MINNNDINNTIQRIAILAFTALLVSIFKEPLFLWALLLLFMTRKSATQRDINEQLDMLHNRIDMLVKHQAKTESDKTAGLGESTNGTYKEILHNMLDTLDNLNTQHKGKD